MDQLPAPRDPRMGREDRLPVGLIWSPLTVSLTAVLVVIVGLAIVYVPRGIVYSDLLAENLEMKSSLLSIDQKMSELDRILWRMRVYDAQLNSLVEPDGDHGPVEKIEDVVLDATIEETWEFLEEELDADGVGPEVTSGEWSDSLEDRLDTILEALGVAEPTLSGRIGVHENLAALQRALPSFWPAHGKLTSPYGYRRSPFNRRWKFHSGIDVAGPSNTPIFAAGKGVVRHASYSGGYGKRIEIDHGYGITTLYGHLRRYGVNVGDEIAEGHLIGHMGRTGQVTGTHLHFEVRMDGHAVDPMDYLIRTD